MSKLDFKVAIFLATGYEMGEAIIIIDLLRRSNINIDIISVENSLSVKSSHNVFINCEKYINDIDFNNYRMLILPGGNLGVENLYKNQLLNSKLIEFQKNDKKIIAAICAAPQIFGQLNLLNNKKISHFPGTNKGLEKSIKTNNKVTVEKNIITGRSIGCVFDFSLKIIEVLLDKTSSDLVKKQLFF